MAERLIYSISTGRCGTVFLSNLIRENLRDDQARVYHERFGFLNFGIHTPDLSHMTAFNTVGNIPYVREFWQRKLRYDAAEEKPVYVELSHVLAKAGLLENLDLLGDGSSIDIIVLTRKIEDIVWSYLNHFDFVNYGFMWPFTLDPRYPNTILHLRPLQNLNPARIAHWYVCEILTRAAYYEQLLRDVPNIRFHRVDLAEITNAEGGEAFIEKLFPEERTQSFVLPEKANATKTRHFPPEARKDVAKICAELPIDPIEMAAQFIGLGKRLSEPDLRSRPNAAAAIERYAHLVKTA